MTNCPNWIKKCVEATRHPVGTCRMGSHPTAVVDGPRLPDASILPTLTLGNTNAPPS
jgi:choline dehydrogenase